MPEKREKLLIVDGNSIIHRAFHALPPLRTSGGVRTNAVYGFITMMQKAMAAAEPDYVVVAFDHSRVTFRHEMYEEYKGTRPETDPELRPQFALVKRLLETWRVVGCEIEGYEADDLFGTLSRQGAAAGLEVLILTGDRDALQLIDSRIKVLLMRRGLSRLDIFDHEAVKKTYGLEPAQLVDVKALMGDPSDNIPGVPGIGEKTALQLIRQYGDLEGVLNHTGEIKSRRLAENLATYAAQARLSRELAAICCEIPVTLNLEACRRRQPDYEGLLSFYKELEFNSLVKDVLREMHANRTGVESNGEVATLTVPEPAVLRGMEELASLITRLDDIQEVAVEIIMDGAGYHKARPLALGLAWEGGTACMDTGDVPAEDLARALEPFLHRNTIYHNAKAVMTWCDRCGVKGTSPSGDTMIAGYLLNPGASRHDLPELCLEHLDIALVQEDSLLNTAAVRAEAVRLLHCELVAKLQAAGMLELYRRVELPLTRILGSMERRGVKVDLDTLELMGAELSGAIDAVTAEIYDLAGEIFNINSPKQLGVILFEKLGLPPVKRTKTGYSTDVAVLEELAAKHEIAAKLVDYRQLTKLRSTYVDGLCALVNKETGTLHTTFNQTVTATGRLSSSEPNLQNIPVRMEMGRRLRKAFVPRSPDHILLAADYSQIELRVLAHISGDPVMTEAFVLGQDIHTRTAAEVFGVSMEAVTPEMRYRAKAVNFGIVYGISDFGLSRDLGISRAEAHDYIERYLRRYAGVKAYMEEIVAKARQDGYVTTLLGRRRYLPDIFSSNFNVRSFGERTAMNTPIQGSAADIIKIAMVKIFSFLEEKYPEVFMLLQVHDELIFDMPGEQMSAVMPVIKEYMENTLELRVPLQVDLKYGPNWYDLKAVTAGEE